MTDVENEVRSYWNVDAATYDDARSHSPRSALDRAAWTAALLRFLPSPPARVLDVGAGTGFLTLLLARQGYLVTAVDLAPRMLELLRDKADQRGLTVSTVEASATGPPKEAFDAVVERHLLWTVPDPGAALAAWREAAPTGRLVLFESMWGSVGGAGERMRGRGRELLRQVRGVPPDHHAEYDVALRAQLPLGRGTSPERLVEEVESSSWGPARVERLRDVEWATRLGFRSVFDRALGVPPRFAVIAG